MMIFGIYRAHAGSPYGTPVACYRADDPFDAWRLYCREHACSLGVKGYAILAV